MDLPYNFVADGEQTEMKPMKNFPFLKLLALRRALKDAGVERLRDLRDDGKREQVVSTLAGDRDVEGLRRDFVQTNLGREARQERRQERRENRRNR